MFNVLEFKEIPMENKNYDIIFKALITKSEDNVFKFVSNDSEFVVYILDSAQSAFIFDYWDEVVRVCNSENSEIARIVADLFDEERFYSISSAQGELKFSVKSTE